MSIQHLFANTGLAILVRCTVLWGSIHNYVSDWNNKHSTKLLIRDWACQKDLIAQGRPSDYVNDHFILNRIFSCRTKFHNGIYKDVANTLSSKMNSSLIL